jgi:hypothetical protein
MKYSLNKLLLNEYSEKLVKQLVDKFKKEDRNADEAQIRWRINRFDQIKNGIKPRLDKGTLNIPEKFTKPDKRTNKIANYLDINQWRYDELENLVDAFYKEETPTKSSDGEEMGGANTAKPEADANLVYNQNGMEIYSAPDKQSCIKYSYEKGGTYRTCIGRKEDASNQYYDYRFGRKGQFRHFYFCFNRSQNSKLKPGTDPAKRDYINWYHFFIIHVSEDNKLYGITDAVNLWDADSTHEKFPISWEQVGQHMIKYGGESGRDSWDKIKNLRNLFTYVAPSEEETNIAAVKGKTLSPDQFKTLNRSTKVAYLNMKNPMQPEMFNMLDVELKNLAINLEYQIPYEALKDNIPLIKRYITVQFIRANKPISADYLGYMDLVKNVQGRDLKKEYYDKYKDKPYINYDHIAKFFPEEVEEYVKDMLSTLDYLPESFVKYLTTDEKDLYYKYSPAYASTYIDKKEGRDAVSSYYLITAPMALKDFTSLDSNQKKAFVEFLKEMITSNRLSKYPALKEVLPHTEQGSNRHIPGYKVENGKLYLQFDGNWYGEDTPALRESLYENWDKYLLKKRAGLIK